jgi:hypothetical protein
MANHNLKENGRRAGGLIFGAPHRESSSESPGTDRVRFELVRANETSIPPPEPGRRRVDWQMVALWIFVSLSFAALALTGYLIWAKCHGATPP